MTTAMADDQPALAKQAAPAAQTAPKAPDAVTAAPVATRPHRIVHRQVRPKPPAPVQVAYRTPSETTCGLWWCGRPFLLMLGIAY